MSERWIGEAIKLPIQAVGLDEVGPYRGRSIFRVTGHPGLWRRVSRSGRRGPTTDDGNVLAVYRSDFIELKRWVEVEGIVRRCLEGNSDVGSDAADGATGGDRGQDHDPGDAHAAGSGDVGD